eukprot:826531-Pyramimonas_sp.AAC.1
MPFILSGDWNLSPDELVGSGWVEAVSGHILSPQLATCTGGKGRVLDYFIVPEGLQYRHKLAVLTE